MLSKRLHCYTVTKSVTLLQCYKTVTLQNGYTATMLSKRLHCYTVTLLQNLLRCYNATEWLHCNNIEVSGPDPGPETSILLQCNHSVAL